jgi:predicted lipoprotein with Yx(FWY)xxD motif
MTKAKVNGHLKNILTDSAGISVYTFELDKPATSVCKKACLNEWPPVHVPSGNNPQSPFGKIVGNDGLEQLTLNGLPLYYYDEDKKTGDTFGQYPQWDVVVVIESQR